MRCYPGLIVGLLLTYLLAAVSSAQPPATGWEAPSVLPSGDAFPGSHPRYPLPPQSPSGAPVGMLPGYSPATVEHLPAVPPTLAGSPVDATNAPEQHAL